MDVLELYRRNAEWYIATVKAAREGQWEAPTPCEGWDVRTLVNHVASEDRWTAPLVEGQTIEQVGDRFEGDLLGADPVGNAVDAAREAERAFTEPGATDRTVHLSFGDTPAAEYAYQLAAEHLIHGWDLAVAIGADRQLDPETVHACAEWFASQEELFRRWGVIGPRVELPEGATEQDRLLSAFGRDSAWRPPS